MSRWIFALLLVFLTSAGAEDRSDYLLGRLDSLLQSGEVEAARTLENHIVMAALSNTGVSFLRSVQTALPFWYTHRSLKKDAAKQILKRVTTESKASSYDLAFLFKEPLHERWNQLTTEQVVEVFKWLSSSTEDFAAQNAACTFLGGRGKFKALVEFLQLQDYGTGPTTVNKMSVLRCQVDALLELNRPSEAKTILDKFEGAVGETTPGSARYFYLTAQLNYKSFMGDFNGVKETVGAKSGYDLWRVEAYILEGDLNSAKTVLSKNAPEYKKEPQLYRNVVKFFNRVDDKRNMEFIAQATLADVLMRDKKASLDFSNVEELWSLLVAFAKQGKTDEVTQVYSLIDKITPHADLREEILKAAGKWVALASSAEKTINHDEVAPLITQFGKFSRFTMDFSLLLRPQEKPHSEAPEAAKL